MKNSHKFVILLSLIFIILMIAGCSTAKEPATIKVIFTPFITNSPFFIAQEEGFFEEQGLNIELAEISSGSQAIPALEKREIDAIGGMINAGFFNAITRGANIKYVADKGHVSTGRCVSSALVASNAFLESNTAENPADIKGAKISTSPAEFSGFWVETLLKQSNLTLDDLDNLNLGTVEEFETIQSGTVDLISTDDPWITRVVEGGFGEVWVNYGDLTPDASYAVVTFGPTLLEDHPDLGDRFMAAYLKGVRQYHQGKTDRNLEILVEYLGLDEELLREACWPPVDVNGTITIESIMDYQEWALGKGLIDEIVDPEDFYDSRFIEFAVKELE